MLGLDLIGAKTAASDDVERTRLRYGVAVGVLGAVVLASVWKAHRVWGGLLGWTAGSSIGYVLVK